MVSANLGSFGITRASEGKILYGWEFAGGAVTGLGDIKEAKPGTWNRSSLAFDGKMFTVVVNGTQAINVKLEKLPPAVPIGFTGGKGVEIMNVFYRELKEK